MSKKENFAFRKLKSGLLTVTLGLIVSSSEVMAQGSSGDIPTDYLNLWNIGFVVLIGTLVFAVYYKYRSKEPEAVVGETFKKSPEKLAKSGKPKLNRGNELEWLTNNGGISGRSLTNGSNGSNGPTLRKLNGNGSNGFAGNKIEGKPEPSFEELPIYSFNKLKPTETFDDLPISSDEGLVSAIEQVHEEYEEDEDIRELAVRVLAAFKTHNSVESLSQVALYDLSSGLRSKAITVLSEFDHESVFETILLSCADPTREVRASAARALFHLTFNRADAWARIAKSEDKGRKSQLARAAIEADLVDRSFERLAHIDRQYAYEAFALVTLLIRTGEMDVIISSLQNQKDEKVRRAILHTIRVSKNKKGLGAMKALLKKKNLVPGLQEEVDKTIEEMGFVTV